MELFETAAISGYSDGTFRSYNTATRAQLVKIVTLALGVVPQPGARPHFSDVPATHPSFGYVEAAYSRGLIAGYADGTFRPANLVTRGQAAKVVVLAFNLSMEEAEAREATATQSFSDVPADHPYHQYIEAAYSQGVVSGYADGTFRPDAQAGRGQVCKMMYNASTQATEDH
jgi:amidase